jgi:hypothetical protein
MGRAVADAEVFERHLDLSRLRGRSRGVVTCIFHPNRGRTPSLSVDIDKGVFCCHSCGAQGGVLRFRELVGEGPQFRPHPGRISDYEQAIRALLRRERALAARRAEWWPWEWANGYVRECRKAVDEARLWAQVLGPDHPRTWNLLAGAARVETEAYMIESRLDELAEGRIL